MRLLFCFGIIALAAFSQPRRNQPRGEAGKFDYYVLSLSWSPQYCSTPAGERDNLQCGGDRRFGFVAHGLWPQFERGWPQFCATGTEPTQAEVKSILDIMPSARLVRHEWSKHGTCSGLNATQYLALVRKAYQVVRTPPEFSGPRQQVQVRPAQLKKRFIETNNLAGDGSVAVLCTGRFLSEVRVCFDKNLKSRACGADVRDQCRVPEMIMQPVR